MQAAADEQQKAGQVHGQRRGLDHGQDRDADHGGGNILGRVAEGADRLRQFRDPAVAQRHLVPASLAHDQQRQHQQQDQVQPDP